MKNQDVLLFAGAGALIYFFYKQSASSPQTQQLGRLGCNQLGGLPHFQKNNLDNRWGFWNRGPRGG